MSRAVFALTALLCAGIATPALARADGTLIEADEARCTRVAHERFGEDVTLTRVVHLDVTPATAGDAQGTPRMSALPAHCRIEGIINARTGADGKDYGIGFAMALPDDWTGRFLLQGGGGLNGSVKPPVGPVASDGTPALARGFAVISHDSGHKGAVFDDSFLADQRAALDFAEASVERVALLGKAIATRYYGAPIAHSYMTGCSTGGREGMLAFQRYPELFDGIVVGAPAMRSADSNLGVEYTQVLFNQAVPKDVDGVPILSQVLTDANRKAILAGILDQCDGLDGLKDGMVENVAQCRFQPARIGCEEAPGEGCLSAGQVRALELGLAGPKDSAGYPLYVRMAADTGIVASPMGYLPTGLPGPFGPPNRATEIDLDASIHAIRNTAWQRLTDTNYWTNLSTYLGRGGKVLFFHGVSDFWFSPFATWDYYQRAAEANGADFTQASRFYMVPGMLHCSGGNSFEEFDLLSAIVAFVEEDKAPEAVTAYRKREGEDHVRESRPLCPYPAHAAYQGGDPRRAESFTCEPPTEAD
ncbi:tannase/feruloyl esterase family alpha/beta hydrolase [Novosphingobium profundi]|uniref:tannase/feruloyl esterase family alpha/beta hydrolase n=1 Tax=Novosphingobium profundi TaxID=1774954 RepID=UPI001CFC8F28|nr:tannase/feruloyl esterase family alpha/beta hydrolase [Novosphingobium profundi]